MTHSPASAAAARPFWFFDWIRQPRAQILSLLTLVAAAAQWRFGILGGWPRVATALGVCVVTEFVLSWFVRGQIARLQSAYMSGLSMILLTKPVPGLLWPFALGGFLAISSKYAITYRGRHLWNPTNFAICLLLLLAPESVAALSQQWGNASVTNAIIWAFGIVIAGRARILDATAGYVISFLALTAARVWLLGGTFAAEVAPLTGPMYQLFVFFMVTDPRTITPSRRGRLAVVATVALVEALIRVAGDVGLPWFTRLYAGPPLFALTFVGPVYFFFYLRRAFPASQPAAQDGGRVTAPAPRPV